MEELQAAGYSPEDIEEIVAANRPQAVGLWPENELPVDIALDCYWQRQYGAMGGMVWEGITGQECEAVMTTHQVPPSDRLAVYRKARLFASEACRALNEREAERAEQAGRRK